MTTEEIAASIAAKQKSWEEGERVAAAEKVAWNKAYEAALVRSLAWHIEAAKTKSGPYEEVDGVAESLDSMGCVERNAANDAAYMAWATL